MTAFSRHPPPYSLSPVSLWRQVRVDTYRATGPGGQHRNRTESAVRLTHGPSGIVVTASESRSQLRNRRVAMQRLIERLAARNKRPKRRRPTRVPESVKKRRLESKRKRGERKRLRTQQYY